MTLSQCVNYRGKRAVWVTSVGFPIAANCRLVPRKRPEKPTWRLEGQSSRSAPRHSDFDLLRYRQSVVDIDAEIAHCALNLRVSEQKMNRS